jgi:hypothetical protein
MAGWQRDTLWRQGELLSNEDAISLGVVNSTSAERIILVAVSHNCDIVNDRLQVEPEVEFIVGTEIDALDGSYTRAKNARILHVEFNTPDGKKAVAFDIRRKVLIRKYDLVNYFPLQGCIASSPKYLQSLRWWLAGRYLRSSFPDFFDKSLTEKKVDEKIDKLLTPFNASVYGFFFLVEKVTDESSGNEELYELRALIVYDSENTEDEEIEKLEMAASNMAAVFEKAFLEKSSKKWKAIELVSCDVVSDNAFSYSDLYKYQQWRLEYRSLEPEPPQSVPFPFV